MAVDQFSFDYTIKWKSFSPLVNLDLKKNGLSSYVISSHLAYQFQYLIKRVSLQIEFVTMLNIMVLFGK